MKKVIGRIRCLLQGVKDLFVHGVWIPHIFKDADYERCIIIATPKNFRVSKDLMHTADEKVYPDACLVRSRCIYCGKEDVSWFPDWNLAMLQLGERVDRNR